MFSRSRDSDAALAKKSTYKSFKGVELPTIQKSLVRGSVVSINATHIMLERYTLCKFPLPFYLRQLISTRLCVWVNCLVKNPGRYTVRLRAWASLHQVEAIELTHQKKTSLSNKKHYECYKVSMSNQSLKTQVYWLLNNFFWPFFLLSTLIRLTLYLGSSHDDFAESQGLEFGLYFFFFLTLADNWKLRFKASTTHTLRNKSK